MMIIRGILFNDLERESIVSSCIFFKKIYSDVSLHVPETVSMTFFTDHSTPKVTVCFPLCMSS